MLARCRQRAQLESSVSGGGWCAASALPRSKQLEARATSEPKHWARLSAASVRQSSRARAHTSHQRAGRIWRPNGAAQAKGGLVVVASHREPPAGGQRHVSGGARGPAAGYRPGGARRRGTVHCVADGGRRHRPLDRRGARDPARSFQERGTVPT